VKYHQNTYLRPTFCIILEKLGFLTIKKYFFMAIAGKLELTIKINEFPVNVETDKNGWKSFHIDCDGQLISINVKPKVFKKLEDAQANFPMWVAAIAGKMGEATEQGFILLEPAIQVFERKPKEPKPTEETAVN
jgi:hypothetical protein